MESVKNEELDMGLVEGKEVRKGWRNERRKRETEKEEGKNGGIIDQRRTNLLEPKRPKEHRLSHWVK